MSLASQLPERDDAGADLIDGPIDRLEPGRDFLGEAWEYIAGERTCLPVREHLLALAMDCQSRLASKDACIQQLLATMREFEDRRRLALRGSAGI